MEAGCVMRDLVLHRHDVWSIQLSTLGASVIARDLKPFLGGVVCNTLILSRYASL